jgi:hypothetical protein
MKLFGFNNHSRSMPLGDMFVKEISVADLPLFVVSSWPIPSCAALCHFYVFTSE